MKKIVAHVFGDRGRKTLDKRLALLSIFDVRFYCTDDFSPYNRLPEEKHLVGKYYTQLIERANLTLRLV
ncbi:hypothetical protein ID858_14985 [Xenorhabdus sp. DI]|nr:hypothetical protein [Xenorhabdus sp. 3]MBD2789804.1 hypothetical protein [Xenorhabdus sp. DI]MBD2796017.1 hypothetical protein [Xenorhabdus sp. 18]